VTQLGEVSPLDLSDVSRVPAEPVPSHGSAHAADFYRPAIDGLRAIAVLSVFIFHLNRRWLPGGFVGVDIFFVISGYLISSVLVRTFERGTFSLAGFYQRRIARLFPMFFLVALSTLLATLFLYTSLDSALAGSNLMWVVLCLANNRSIDQGAYFKISQDAQPFLHYWSLSLEEQFYIFVPAVLYILHHKIKSFKSGILLALWAASFAACVALTKTHPIAAFYLLPTRAWELLTGSILAIWATKVPSDKKPASRGALAVVGLLLIIVSLVVVREGQAFPGYISLLPVLGTALVIGHREAGMGLVERALSSRWLVLIGRASYSLYLWHWPVFSLIDYEFYSMPFVPRTAFKIVLTVFATVLSFTYVEQPGRRFLNLKKNRRTAFAFFTSTAMILIIFGYAVRHEENIDSTWTDLAHGGLKFNDAAKRGSMILLGDSKAACFGKTMKEISMELDYRLIVIAMSGETPLPVSSGNQSDLWEHSFAIIKQSRPDVVVLAFSWLEKLKDDPERLSLTINELKPYVRNIILVTDPPYLAVEGTREAMRDGSRPPFFEDTAYTASWTRYNDIVKSMQGPGVTVVDVVPVFMKSSGEIAFSGSDGKQIFQNRTHISGYGAALTKPMFLQAIAPIQAH
jgi:peptidoglycan/LPS O-acetylase OafA/YrhL